VSRPGRAARERARRVFVRQMLTIRPHCQAQLPMAAAGHEAAQQCYGLASEVHEPLTRARGGSTTDPANALTVCPPCHRWIHDNPADATALGLLIPSS
jgi:hypothetical protein